MSYKLYIAPRKRFLQIRGECSTVGEIAGRQVQATLKESAKFCPVAVSAPLKSEDQEVWYNLWSAVL